MINPARAVASERTARPHRSGHLLFPSDRIVPGQLGVVHLYVTKREKPMVCTTLYRVDRVKH